MSCHAMPCHAHAHAHAHANKTKDGAADEGDTKEEGLREGERRTGWRRGLAGSQCAYHFDESAFSVSRRDIDDDLVRSNTRCRRES